MTIKQKQCLLFFMGYYTGNIDGIWGAKSQEATLKFQNDYGLPTSGMFDDATADKIKAAVAGTATKVPTPAEPDWKDIKYFTKKEFRCKCGGKYCNGYPAEVDMTMVKVCDMIRQRIGKPISVNSGLRCKQHNANCGGATASRHMYGDACDLGKPSGVTPAQMAKIAEDILGDSGGIGIYSWGIHVDTRRTKARWNG
jgi:hypothetical protein